MIFVTVGTHEQPFNRLIQKIDELKRAKEIIDDVIIQTGFSTYEPQYCRWKHLFPYNDMKENVYKARIVITHGGPSSFIMPLQIGKIPIVVPRKHEYGEHVNNHQVLFSSVVEKRYNNLIVVDDIEKLGDIIKNYNNISQGLNVGVLSHNAEFCNDFEKIVNELVHDR